MGAFSFLIQLWLQVYCSQKPKKSIQAMHWTGLRLLRRHCMFTGPWRCKRGSASCRNQQEIISAPKCNLHLQKPLLPQISVSFRTEHAYTHTHTEPICFNSAKLAQMHPYLLHQHPRPFTADKREMFMQGGCGNTALSLARSPMPCFQSQINHGMDSLSVFCRQWLQT